MSKRPVKWQEDRGVSPGVSTGIEPAAAKLQDGAKSETSLTERAAWIMFAKAVAYGLSFALPLLLVRRLSQHDFGVYKQVFLVVGTAITMLPLGFGMSAYYFLPRELERQGHIVFNILLFYTATAGAACLTLIMWPELLLALFTSSELVEHAPVIGALILLLVVSSFLEIIAVAHQEPKMATVFIIGSQLIKSALLMMAAAFFPTVETILHAALIQGLLQTAILFLYLRSRFPGFWRKFDPSVMRRQLSYALPFGLAGLVFAMQMDFHNYFVANRFGPATYAIYAVGCFQLPLVGIVTESVSSVIIPRISFMQKLGQRQEIIALTASVMRKLAIVYFPLYAFLIVTGREFIVLVFTEQYLDSWPIFLVNLTLLPAGILLLDPIQRAYAGEGHFLLKLHAALFVILLVALWVGTSRLGPIGAVLAVVGASLIGRLIMAIRLGRLVGVTRADVKRLGSVAKVAIAAAAAGSLTALVRSLLSQAEPYAVLAVCFIVFSPVYLAAISALAVLAPKEWEAIRCRLVRVPQGLFWRGGTSP